MSKVQFANERMAEEQNATILVPVGKVGIALANPFCQNHPPPDDYQSAFSIWESRG